MAEIREVEGALGVLPDVLLAHTVVATVLPHLASRLKLPLVWWLHEFGDVDHGFRYSPSREDFSRWVKGVATVVVANSESVRDHFFGEDSSEIPVIGYLIQGLDNVPTTPRTSDHVSLGVVARIETSKGHSTVLEAVALLVERGTSVSLHLYGSGSTRAVINLKNLVRSLGLEKQVIFHGYVDDAEAIFASLDAVVVASVSEALGRVPIEAGLRGVPVFFNPRGHLASLLEDGVTGISFDSDSPSSLASRIDSLFSNSLDYEKLRLTAWHHWRDSLSVGDYRAEWLGVLKQAQRNYLERAM
jgi:glycosyltransferase involved in cell wall biosynthesis